MQVGSTSLPVVVAQSSAVALVVASAGFGALFAYKVGIEHSILLAGLSVVMAVALEAVKPLAIAHALQFRSGLRSVALGLLGAVAVAYSLTSELSLVAMSRSDLTAQRVTDAQAARYFNETRDRVTRELVSLGITRPPAEITQDLKPYAGRDCENARPGSLCARVVLPLRAELARAERREALEFELNRLNQGGGSRGSSGVSDPASHALAVYLAAVGLSLHPERIGQWLLLVPVLALELGSALALVLVQALRREESPVVLEPRQTVHPEGEREKVSAALVNHLKNHGGVIEESERTLAKRLGADRSTVRRAMHGLAAMGMIAFAASKNGTAMRLVS